jgi:hypothetical protein
MLIGFCAFCSAQTTHTTQKETKTTVETVAKEDAYKKVKMEELSMTVQNAIKKNYAGLKVKSLAYHPEKKLTRITFVAQNGKEKVVILNAEGKEHKG